MQPLKSEMRIGSRKKKKVANVVNKLDNLYTLIRRLGLHYKISENFGSTTITIGRNYHGFDELLDVSSSDKAKHAPERDESFNMQAATKTTLENMDMLYKFVRGLGLHYRLTENYGSTSITIGRNYHPFAELYEDLSVDEGTDPGIFDNENNRKIKTESNLSLTTEMAAHYGVGDLKSSEKAELEELLSAYEFQNWKIREDSKKVSAEMKALKITNSNLSAHNSLLVEQELSQLKQKENLKSEIFKLSEQIHTLQSSNDLLQQEVDKIHEEADKKSLLLKEENNKLRVDLLSLSETCSKLEERNKCVDKIVGSRWVSRHSLREEVTRLKEEERERDVDLAKTANACEMAEKTQEVYRGMLEDALNGNDSSWKVAARDMMEREEKKARPKVLNKSTEEESWMDFTHCRQDSKPETWCADCIDDYARYWNQGLIYNPTTGEWTKRTVSPRKNWVSFFHCRGAGEPFGTCGNCNKVSCFWDEELFWNSRNWVARDGKRSTAPEGNDSATYEYWMGHFHCRQDSKLKDRCDDCHYEFGYYWSKGLYWNGDGWVKKHDVPDDDVESDAYTEDSTSSDDSMEIIPEDRLHQTLVTQFFKF